MPQRKIQQLEMINISKSFPNVVANDCINLCINAGEILALIGENGAGKTTLMNILFGLYKADKGEIKINNEIVTIKNPKDALDSGIGMVHQHFMLIPAHSVAENIALGLKDLPFFFPEKIIEKKLEDFSEKYNLKINPESKIWQLSAGEQQRVEIIKILLRGANLLILDEPTSVLTPQETKDLFDILIKLSGDGHLIILITHKLKEVMEVSQKVLVLRRGKVTGYIETQKTSEKELAHLMIGEDISFKYEKKEVSTGSPILGVNKIRVRSDQGMVAIKDLSFNVHEREIFGIAGVSGNGQKELVEAITGLRKVEKGTINIDNQNVINLSPKLINKLGVSHIPEERMRYGVVPNLLIFENTILNKYYKKPFSKFSFLSYSFIREYTYKIANKFQVNTPSINIPVKSLSGGNIQKLIFGREISEKAKLIIASHPTYGLDINATRYIRELLIQKREEGSAILLLSEDLDEILELSDKSAVIFEGEFMGIMNPKDIGIGDIGLMMAGSKRILNNESVIQN